MRFAFFVSVTIITIVAYVILALAEPAPDLEAPLEERPVGGLGIHILRALADEAHSYNFV